MATRGTLPGIMNNWAGAKLSVGKDPIYGRWSWITLQGKNNRTIILVRAYRVNPGHQNFGEFSVYKQQYNLMLQQEHESQDPRTQTIIDLENFIQAQIENQEEIILSIDANKTIEDTPTPKPSSIRSMSENLGLINLTTISTHQQETHTGGICIDFCFITPNILPAIKAFRYLTFDCITSTDHQPYYLDLEVQTLFAHTPDMPQNPTSRLLKSTMPNRKKRYIQSVTSNFKEQFLVLAATNLQTEAAKQGVWTSQLQQKYENIDTKAT